MGEAVVVLRQRQPLWLRVFIAIFTVFFLIVLGTIILDGDPRHLIRAVPTVVLVCLGVGCWCGHLESSCVRTRSWPARSGASGFRTRTSSPCVATSQRGSTGVPTSSSSGAEERR